MLKTLGIGRFQVMALLQAARYYVLKGNLDKAKSFGLNRAIFYAWAKYYGPSKGAWIKIKVDDLVKRRLSEIEKVKCSEGFTEVLGECVQVGRKGFFKIGDKEQDPKDFDEQVLRKVSKVIDPKKVWEAAVNYVRQYPEWVLKDPKRFYKLVYEPIRDEFFNYLLNGLEPTPPKDILEKVRASDRLLEEARRKQRSLIDFMDKD